MERGSISIVDGRVLVSPVGGEVWLTKHEIADLFECFVAKVDANVRATLKAGVLDEDKVCRTMRYSDDSSVMLYNLEMITALAFRIKSRNSDAFRRWLMARAVAGKKISVIVSPSNQMLLN